MFAALFAAFSLVACGGEQPKQTEEAEDAIEEALDYADEVAEEAEDLAEELAEELAEGSAEGSARLPTIFHKLYIQMQKRDSQLRNGCRTASEPDEPEPRLLQHQGRPLFLSSPYCQLRSDQNKTRLKVPA